jgi:predicted  nucleic acid-binding Zn-ribbon protein
LQIAEKRVHDIRESIKSQRIQADSKQLQMKEREGKIHHWQGQLNMATENREYKALKDQIAAETQANLVLSDEILEMLEGLDAIAETLADAEAQVVELRSECDRIEKQISERKLNLESELARVQAELADAEKGLSGEFKREYIRLVAARGEDAMAAVEGKCCSGCYQSLTPQLLEQLSIGKPVICSSCGRLIYMES